MFRRRSVANQWQSALSITSLIAMKAALKIHKQLSSYGLLACRAFKAGRRRNRDLWLTQLWCGNLPILWRRTAFGLARDGSALVWRLDRQNEVTWLSRPSWPLKYDVLWAGWGLERALRVISNRKAPLWPTEKTLKEILPKRRQWRK